jgi:hypothetical protein
MYNGVKSAGLWTDVAALFFVDDAVATAVTEPLPGVAVPVLVPPAFCEPAPVRPGPLPAPVDIYYYLR